VLQMVIRKKVHGNNVHGKNGPRKIGPLGKKRPRKKVHPKMKKAEKRSHQGEKIVHIVINYM